MNKIKQSMLDISKIKRLFNRAEEVDGCLIWRGQHHKQHPYVFRGGKQYGVARLVHAHKLGFCVRTKVQHTCGNTMCIKPEHLVSVVDSYLEE